MKQNTPFWKPWTAWGYLWRTLVYLAGMALICLLLGALMRGCQMPNPNALNPFANRDSVNPYPDLPPELKDSSLVKNFVDSIPGVKELPDPDDNFIPPVDSSRVIVNPDDSLSQIVCDQLVVFFNSKDLKKDMASFAQQFKQNYPSNGYEIIYYNPVIGTMLLAVPQERLLEVAEELPQKITGIDFRVATNEILEQSAMPSDPDFSVAAYNEYFKLIQAYDAWAITKGKSDVKVAIVDSYFDLTNAEINKRYVDRIFIPNKTKNVLPPAARPNQNNVAIYCHGSHVAGLAIGAQSNGVGCSGIAPGCSWIPIALGDQLTSFNIMEGLLYAVYRGADVVNLSIGRNFPQDAKNTPIGDQVRVATMTDKMGEALWEYIVKTANDHNCVIVTAAGNNSVLMGMDPKNRSTQMVKVEAVDGKGKRAEFSNFGEVKNADVNYSTVSAPGVNLWSAAPKHALPMMKAMKYKVDTKNGLQEMSGTSMASPVVAGAVALLKSKNKDLTTEQVIKILTMTGKRFDNSNTIGPTIQLKDALNATGGDLANFDDLMKNHKLLIGKWKSTKELSIGNNGKTIDDMWTYFIFTSPTSGRVEHHTINSRKVYTAKLTVTWGNNKITINQAGPAATASGETVNKDDFVCTPDKNRLLNATCIQHGKNAYNFQLEKVN